MSKRQLSLTIDLGDAQFQIERMEAVEALSRPFVINLDIISTLGGIELYPHLGNAATITVREDDVLMRYFHGILVEGEYLSERPVDKHVYRLTLRPWTHLVAHNRDFAIFQNKSTIDIVSEVLTQRGLGKVNVDKLTTTPRTREYCVQYGESDFAFASRLLEEDGYYYFFEHGESQHEMVLCDSPQSHSNGPVPTIVYNPNASTVTLSGSAVRSDTAAKRFMERWTERVATTADNLATMRDFDFLKPQKPVDADANIGGEHTLDALDVYDWPGGYVTKAEGDALSKVALESRRANRLTYSGETQLASLSCGSKFTLESHPFDRLDQGYLVTRTHHVLSSEQYESGTGGGGGHIVYCQAVPDKTLWRAPQVTPRPIVRGPETAIVTGPHEHEEDEVYTEKYGRIKVRFHWDRSGSEDKNSTCWIRVSQTGGLGNIILPRIGHEVLVDFLDGNPDRPIVVGRVFNDDHQPVYGLPAENTKALWRTKTFGKPKDDENNALALDVANPGANELRFDDKNGEEEVFVHAQKNMNTRIRHSETHHIGRDQDIKMGGNRTIKIIETDRTDVDKSINVKAGTTIEIEAETSITFIVGQTKMVLDKTSVSITTQMFKTEAGATADVKSPMTTIKGEGTLTLKGGMTLIN